MHSCESLPWDLVVRQTARSLSDGDVRTDLYYNHSEGKHIRLLCIPVAFYENLRGSPPCGVSLYLGHKDRIQPTNNRGKAEVCQTSVAAMVDEDIGLAEVHQCSLA